MPKVNPRAPDTEEVKSMAQEIMERMHVEMSTKMNEVTANLSLSTNEVDKQVFTLLEGYRTACVSFTVYCNDVISNTGKNREKSIISLTDPVQADGLIN